MHFIQETGFSFELGQIEIGCDADDLTQLIEKECARATSSTLANCGSTKVQWRGAIFVVWYCANGDVVTLISIIPAYP
jgi:hypothetical protein